ncbi:MAG: DUF885 domain-containing protein [Gammaproteobacteria bacterium]|nr:DUF885 domain-containing protein [Gammaproteobacteria bacterium]
MAEQAGLELPTLDAATLDAIKSKLADVQKSSFADWSSKEFGTESERANALFDAMFDQAVDRSPSFQTFLGIKKDYGKWDDNSQERQFEELELTKLNLAMVKDKIDFDKLDAQTKISYRLAVDDAEREIKNFKYRYHNYPVNQMFGVQSGAPSFLINFHRITDVSDAEAYISRLNGLMQRFDNVITGLDIRADLGIMAPKFVYPYVVSDSKNIITGKPFDESENDSTLLADFKKKIAGLELDQAEAEALINKATAALTDSVKPAYEKLIAKTQELEAKATTDDGAWKLPDGEAFYNMALARTTTTSKTADEIHNIGLSEVARIHDEMRAIMKTVGFEGDLQAFFEFMRVDKQFYKPETDAGREEYLQENRDVIEHMKSRLDELFLTKPKADLIVKRVEPFREKSAGKAFYNSPAPDGSRPGIYYANLYKMSEMPTYQMEALAYHEGIPGHHMQLAISQELTGLPKFRKFGGYTAHTEGWGLYSEYLPKEIGLYENPYSDFGRLAMELWRACRLVVDTGIHDKKWTREQGIEYYTTNTPNPVGDAVKMVERHIVIPSQATAYKVGMLKILELREQAKKDLGDKFDIREFHDVVITNGALPLNVLEQLVNEWVTSKA